MGPSAAPASAGVVDAVARSVVPAAVGSGGSRSIAWSLVAVALMRCFKRSSVSTLRKIRSASTRTELKSEWSSTLYDVVNQVWKDSKALIALKIYGVFGVKASKSKSPRGRGSVGSCKCSGVSGLCSGHNVRSRR